MKNFLFFLFICFVVAAFFGYGEVKRYQTNIKIEADPAYTLGIIKRIEPENEYKAGQPGSYTVNYEFKVAGKAFSGSTNSVDYDQAKSYKQRIALKVAYLTPDPAINTPASYFRPGKTAPELKQGLVISALLGLAVGIPVFFFIGFIMWIIRKIRGQL